MFKFGRDVPEAKSACFCKWEASSDDDRSVEFVLLITLTLKLRTTQISPDFFFFELHFMHETLIVLLGNKKYINPLSTQFYLVHSGESKGKKVLNNG